MYAFSKGPIILVDELRKESCFKSLSPHTLPNLWTQGIEGFGMCGKVNYKLARLQPLRGIHRHGTTVTYVP